ncbi:MAG: hypothetical protein ACHQQ3_04800 [Gemmatimonadales bacterium]
MSHLFPERLAALSDDTPTPIEAAHITSCDACSAELSAQRKLARMAAAAQVTPGAPLSSFAALAPRLRAEGLIAVPDRRAMVRTWSVRIAAGLVLVAGGAVGGRMTAAHELPMLPTASASNATSGSVSLPAQPSTAFKTSDDAFKALAVSQQTYQSAAAFLAAQDTSAHFIGLNQNTYRTRLKALDDIAAATRAALYQAPQDPVLNQYYLGTLSAREATLGQLRQVTPAANIRRSW